MTWFHPTGHTITAILIEIYTPFDGLSFIFDAVASIQDAAIRMPESHVGNRIPTIGQYYPLLSPWNGSAILE